jgi:tetrahydromethanopterin S-methyltransferase subunit F
MDVFSTAIRLYYVGDLCLRYQFMGFNARLRLGHFKTRW